jgi:hypothetical protein
VSHTLSITADNQPYGLKRRPVATLLPPRWSPRSPLMTNR